MRNRHEGTKARRHEGENAIPFVPSCLRASVPLRKGSIRWSALAFLFVFSIVAVLIAYYTLIPGMEAAKNASPDEKRRLVAWYRLLLTVLLFILFAGLVLTVRFGRFFFPRPTPPRVKTPYVDAWAESAKRLDLPPQDQDEE